MGTRGTMQCLLVSTTTVCVLLHGLSSGFVTAQGTPGSNYSLVTCNFSITNCGWTNVGGEYTATWVLDGTHAHMYMRMNGNAKGRLASPWLDPLEGYECSLKFDFVVDKWSWQGCGLALIRQTASGSEQKVKDMTSDTGLGTRSDTATEAIDCTGERYRIVFEGRKSCDNIWVDDIVYTLRYTGTPRPTDLTSTAGTTVTTGSDDTENPQTSSGPHVTSSRSPLVTSPTSEHVTSSTSYRVTSSTSPHVTSPTSEHVTSSTSYRVTSSTSSHVTSATSPHVTSSTSKYVTSSASEHVTSTSHHDLSPTDHHITSATTRHVTSPTSHNVTSSTIQHVTFSTSHNVTSSTSHDVTSTHHHNASSTTHSATASHGVVTTPFETSTNHDEDGGSTDAMQGEADTNSSALDAGSLAGIIIGGIVVVVVVVVIVMLIFKRRRRQDKPNVDSSGQKESLAVVNSIYSAMPDEQGTGGHRRNHPASSSEGMELAPLPPSDTTPSPASSNGSSNLRPKYHHDTASTAHHPSSLPSPAAVPSPSSVMDSDTYENVAPPTVTRPSEVSKGANRQNHLTSKPDASSVTTSDDVYDHISRAQFRPVPDNPYDHTNQASLRPVLDDTYDHTTRQPPPPSVSENTYNHMNERLLPSTSHSRASDSYNHLHQDSHPAADTPSDDTYTNVPQQPQPTSDVYAQPQKKLDRKHHQGNDKTPPTTTTTTTTSASSSPAGFAPVGTSGHKSVPGGPVQNMRSSADEADPYNRLDVTGERRRREEGVGENVYDHAKANDYLHDDVRRRTQQRQLAQDVPHPRNHTRGGVRMDTCPNLLHGGVDPDRPPRLPPPPPPKKKINK